MRMRPTSSMYLSLLTTTAMGCCGFTSGFTSTAYARNHRASSKSQLAVSIGLGPEKKEGKQEEEEERELIPGVDYEVPDHESLRTARRSKLDERCDRWFRNLLDEKNGILGDVAEEARERILTPVPITNEVQAPFENKEEWTPYVTTKLPWSPLYVAYGLEEFGLPVPRRNAETWRHFDVAGLVNQDYSTLVADTGTEMKISEEDLPDYKAKIIAKGGWLEDDECAGRLVYINGRFAPQLSKTNDMAFNLASADDADDEVKGYLSRLTDGFTDELAAPVPSGPNEFLTSFKKLSGPDHCTGDPTSQFAINTQQGTACFAALNTMLTGGVAMVRSPANYRSSSNNNNEDEKEDKPVLIVNVLTSDGGAETKLEDGKGVACHPRALVVAEEDSQLSVVQSCIDFDAPNDNQHNPKFYNGYTQFVIKTNSNVTHSYMDESGGMVSAGVESIDEARQAESKRPTLKDAHMEAIDVQIVGDDATYEGALIDVGGSGRVRAALSVSLLRPRTHASVKGFALSGGFQRTDMKTNIHHVAQGTTSNQIQKNMIGGRAIGAFRGRIRVEQSAQQTNSDQISRTILLSDRCKAWAVPSLEIVADDVQCTHGATVSDLSEEELFYLRSRGLSQSLARNLLMYAFAGDVSGSVHPSMLSSLDSSDGFGSRVIQRLENLVPQGERAVKGDFQSV